ncbi:MAG: YcjX family protein [Rhodobacteraceae bacterium]|nr:YcjX family protein [Paracoccaceae bacterium]
MWLGDLVDDVTRRIEGAGASVSEALFEPVVRLGVTGLAGAGKTVFITSLVANLLERARMDALTGAREGRIAAAYLQPQPDDTVPRFDFEAHMAALSGADPRWPQSTRRVSQLRLSFRVRPGGLLGGLASLAGPRTVHLDIVDYPGEWLLDLQLMDLDYAGWSQSALARAATPAHEAPAAAFRGALAAAMPEAPFAEEQARALALGWTGYLEALAQAGRAGPGPGRFLLPGEMEGSPALTFAPLPRPARVRRGSLWAEMERRFDAYRREIVRPFFRDHFARIDRQIVLADVLGAIHAGPAALEDMRQTLASILQAFRPGRNSWLAPLLGRRVDRLLLAATRADHLHHTQHPRLSAIVEALLSEARGRADFAGARTAALAMASLRATVEADVPSGGGVLPGVRGRLLDENGRPGREVALYPGDLPEDPGMLLAPAREGAEDWLDQDFGIMRFAPAPLSRQAGRGLPHIRLDRAAEFLFGDRLS